ncbi:MAG: Ig-like domain-containing protein [Isosphaerales bacterium]
MPDWTIDANESVAPLIQATDPAGAALTYSASIAGGAPATVRVIDGELVVTPDAGYTGTLQVNVTATKGLASSTSSFHVTVVVPALARSPPRRSAAPPRSSSPARTPLAQP